MTETLQLARLEPANASKTSDTPCNPDGPAWPVRCHLLHTYSIMDRPLPQSTFTYTSHPFMWSTIPGLLCLLLLMISVVPILLPQQAWGRSGREIVF